MLIYIIIQSTKQQISKTEHHISEHRRSLMTRSSTEYCNSKGNHNGLSGIIHFISCHESGTRSIKHIATTKLLRQCQMHEKLWLWLQIFMLQILWVAHQGKTDPAILQSSLEKTHVTNSYISDEVAVFWKQKMAPMWLFKLRIKRHQMGKQNKTNSFKFGSAIL